jgi:hypothetical protein
VFDRIVINWGVRENGNNVTAAPSGNGSSLQKLLPANWPSNVATPLQMHLIQTGGSSFTLDNFDNNSGTQTNRGSLAMIPVGSGGTPMSLSSPLPASRLWDSNNKATTNAPLGVNCVAPSAVNTATDGSGNFVAGYWSCSATIMLPAAIGGARNMGTSFLRLENIYGKATTDFQVLLFNGTTPVRFAGVQMVVDATGRAGDRFRRVEGRIEVVDLGFAYPEFSAELYGDGSQANFCKDYVVTINSWVGENFINDGNCP